MKIRCEQFQELSRKGLEDRHLQEAFRGLGVRLKEMRNSAFSLLENGEELRDQAHEIKGQTLVRLDEYLENLETKIIELGGKVHWASTAYDARRLIEKIAMERGVTRIVKGKSMVTEEIALNRQLIDSGIEVFETDLGEFIIQLANEPPSHIVGPALHKTKGQIAELFSEKLGVRLTEDPEEMTMVARRVLREKFLKAEMGITGVNFAVSETGTIVLFENEGNIRLTTTVPKVHVAIMGIEKVVPTFTDLSVLMKLLARSCTGQKLSCYVSLINGPKRDGEWDGAEEFHLVILDNGRSRILADRELRETLYCIRCGACLNFCPVYLRVGGHAYGWVYPGPIGSILTPQLVNRKQAYPLPYASTLCGACAGVCPVKIDIPKALVALRRKYVEDPSWESPTSRYEKGIFNIYATIMQNKQLYKSVSCFIRKVQGPFLKKGRRISSPPPFNRWSSYHEVDPLEEKSFRQLWKERQKGDRWFEDE